jgi:hypothetical protein
MLRWLHIHVDKILGRRLAGGEILDKRLVMVDTARDLPGNDSLDVWRKIRKEEYWTKPNYFV